MKKASPFLYCEFALAKRNRGSLRNSYEPDEVENINKSNLIRPIFIGHLLLGQKEKALIITYPYKIYYLIRQKFYLF